MGLGTNSPLQLSTHTPNGRSIKGSRTPKISYRLAMQHVGPYNLPHSDANLRAELSPDIPLTQSSGNPSCAPVIPGRHQCACIRQERKCKPFLSSLILPRPRATVPKRKTGYGSGAYSQATSSGEAGAGQALPEAPTPSSARQLGLSQSQVCCSDHSRGSSHSSRFLRVERRETVLETPEFPRWAQRDTKNQQLEKVAYTGMGRITLSETNPREGHRTITLTCRLVVRHTQRAFRIETVRT